MQGLVGLDINRKVSQNVLENVLLENVRCKERRRDKSVLMSKQFLVYK